MPTVINTNLASLYAQNSLSNAQNNLANSVQRLSSGLRINSAKDDAAGLAISQSMQNQINGVNQSRRNLNDATNLIQVADTSMGTIQDMLLRMKTLGTEFGNNALSTDQKTAITTEAQSIKDQVDLTIKEAVYNGVNLLDTSGSTTYDIQSGVDVGTTISFTVANATVDTTATDFSVVDADLLRISNERAKMGALVGRATYSSQNLMAQSANMQNARSAIVDTDFASETAQLTKGQIMQQAATAMLAQANQMPNVILSLLK
jgi:flagellin